jgi:glycosyltransferase involved in cell wall biosynthesis
MKFSIITVNYNNKEGLMATIESVIHQSFSDYEFIVIDGGSSDGALK